MVMIEMRDASYDHAFELLDEAKDSAKHTKLTLCELEDAMYDCYEASKEDREDEEYEPEESEIEFRGRRGYRHDKHYGEHEDDDELHYRRAYRRSRSRLGMRRRNRMGRFV